MIEIVEEKNKPEMDAKVKQVGKIGTEKVYIEDYVISYLKQCIRRQRNEQTLILYGRKEIIDKNPTWFVSGVLHVPEEEAHKKTLVTEKDWRTLNNESAKFFPGLGVLGLAFITDEEVSFSEEKVENTFVHFFREDQKLFLLFDEDEIDGNLYFYEQDKLIKQEGYFEYYEKNEQMQTYMLYEQEQKGEITTSANETSETGNDHAARQFRAMLAQKQKENAHKKALIFMYGMSAVLAVVIVMIGITIMGNYDQMNHMQNALSQLSGQVEDGFAKEETPDDATQVVSISQNEYVAVQPTPARINTETVVRAQVLEKPSELDEHMEETKEQEEQENGMKGENTEVISETVVPAFYEIRKGDTLEKISIRFYGDGKKVKDICELNHIKDQNTILYGQKIVLP